MRLKNFTPAVLALIALSHASCQTRENNESSAAEHGSPESSLLLNYQHLGYQEKLDLFWKRIQESRYREKLPALENFGLSLLIDTLTGSASVVSRPLAVTFDHESDFIPAGRRKFIHSYGSVAKIRFVAAQESPYSGIFKGAVGLARLSIAGDPRLNGNVFGMALKFFVTGKPSVNTFLMFTLDGQGNDANFFAHPFSTHLPEPKNPAIKSGAQRFATERNPPNELTVDHLAKWEQDGTQPAKAKAPYALQAIPVQPFEWPSDSTIDFRERLSHIPKGTLLYKVLATESKDGAPKHIGDLVTDSEVVASKFGDEELFFQHPR